MELHAAGILLPLAVALFAALCVRRSTALGLAAVFVAATVLFRVYGPPEIGTMAACVTAAAVTALCRPRWLPVLAPAAAGICAAAWISVLQRQGLPWPPAALGAGGLALTAAGLAARRPGFAAADVRDEALVLVAVFALLLGTGPGVVEGWRSAVALTAEPLAAEGILRLGPWSMAAVLGSVLLGGAYTAWKRR